ncbi:CBS domain-containing protein CBSX5-like [Phoenix dactylifera]|uniref:CBS domain-containing protein CBSX5-like n=1 Tax=Phoenix dactylifera TaxID=42345 RepID=A0A8B7CU83_PHODC|nr:CBS domain-containing protein CBSX5-like [Phoenix dactylifera]
MAVSLLSHDVSDLCIGKPALKSLPLSATAGDALLALKKGGDTCLALSAADRYSPERNVIPGKLCVADILCFLCVDENLDSPVDALKKPVSDFLPKDTGLVRRVEPHSSVLEALDVILEGAPCLAVPIRSGGRRKLPIRSVGGGGAEFCWLTQEDFVRYFFSSIAHFAPIAAHSVSSLGLVRSDVLAIQYHDAALNALPLIRRALADQTSVAVITDDGKLVGEISPSTLAACDETVAAALVTLSVGDLMAYIDYCDSPPEGIVRAIKARLMEKGFKGMLKLIEEEPSSPFSSSSSSSSEDEESAGRKLRRLRSVGMRRSSEEAIVCHSESSLVAVMVQALAHRVNYVWVVDEEDYSLLGIVTFADVLKVFREQLEQPLGI